MVPHRVILAESSSPRRVLEWKSSRPRRVLKYRLKIRVSIYLFLSVGRKMTPFPETASDPKLSAQGGLGSPGSPSLFEASAVGVLSLHRLHLSRNCSIFRHCVDDVAFAGLSDVVCALHAASCCRCLLRSRWILVGVLQRCFGWKSRISSHLLCLLSCVIWMWNYSWFTDRKHCFIDE